MLLYDCQFWIEGLADEDDLLSVSTPAQLQSLIADLLDGFEDGDSITVNVRRIRGGEDTRLSDELEQIVRWN